MMERSGTLSTAGHHQHCDKCHNLHCQVPVQVSISCAIIKCRKNCGACFHLCKEEDHHVLCPNETVPCINANFGCPLSMPRCRLAQHLRSCPASVVCCSQDWNRWPIPDETPPFYVSISQDQQTRLHLDVAMALRDQDRLFRSIKMKSVFPELMVADSVPEACASGATVNNSPLPDKELVENGCAEMEVSQEERDALAKSRTVENIQKYSSWEKMFKKEMDGCKESVKNLDQKQEREKDKAGEESHSCQRETSGEYHLSNGHADSMAHAALGENGATGLAPWQDGVLERLGKEVHISEYNMYLMHNGAMLINFGQLEACTPREKDFVYGSLEPIEVKTIHSFNVPTSYRAKRHLKDPSQKGKMVHKSVDTADLGVLMEDLPKCDEVPMTLLCALEKELKGHSISQNAPTDALDDNVGTQTYNFHSAPFQSEASLMDIMPPENGLYLNIETESVTRRHNKSSSAFSCICGHFFRRDEFRSHFKNVHTDIQSCLNGWFQQRCPLAYRGCTYTQTRFHPSGQQATIKYCQDVDALVLQPQTLSSSTFCQSEKKNTKIDHLSQLPLEVLQHIAGYLDSFTLSQLSQVSHLMRDACATLLQDRGMVFLKWEKTDSHGESSWRCWKKIWTFSFVFSTVNKWSFSDNPSMSEHLKSCPHYHREERFEPVALPCLGEVTDRQGAVCPSR